MKIKPPVVLGSIFLGCLMMWIGPSSGFPKAVKITLLFTGGLLVGVSSVYCAHQLYKIISGKL